MSAQGDRTPAIRRVPPARILLCMGPCHGEFYLPLELDEPLCCPNDRTHPFVVYTGPVMHAGDHA